MKYYLLVIFVAIFLWNDVSAQNAPKLNCVRNDNNDKDVILEYDLPLPSAGCGPITNFEIFASQTGRNGVYSSFAFINDVTKTTHVLPNAGQSFEELYFFLVTNAPCSGVKQDSSAILSNIKPKKPVDISHVTVNDGGQIELYWEDDEDPEIGGYRIYVDNTSTFTEIGDIPPPYVDLTGTDPKSGPHTYYVRSLDFCESGTGSATESPIVAGTGFSPHTTIFLDTTGFDACDRSLGIEWTPYDNSPDDILNYKVYVSVDGGPENNIEVVLKNTLSTRIPDLKDGSTITIRVAAEMNNNGLQAFSNKMTIKVNVTAAPSGGYIRNASVIDGMLTIEYIEDVDGVVVDEDLLSSINGQNFGNPGAIKITPNQFIYEDRNGDPNTTAYYYHVSRRGQCGPSVATGNVRTMFAQNKQISDEEIEVSWNEFEIANGAVTGYEVETYRNGKLIKTTPLSAGTTSYADDGVLQQDSLFTFCYRIRAIYDITAPVDGAVTERGLESLSNETCFQLKPSVFVPSIFNPLSTIDVNRRIRPFIRFGSPEGYTFMIHNRWGELMYQTDDINDEGWTGDNAPMESYVYYVRFLDQEGQPVEKKGTFVLMR